MCKSKIPPPLCAELALLERYFARLCEVLHIDPRIPPSGYVQGMPAPCFTERIRLLTVDLDYLILPLVKKLVEDKPKEEP